MGLCRHIQRLRHRKGFGVHSPFAFSLIADTAEYPGHYYGDDLLRATVGNRRGTLRRQAWLLHRLIARLDPECVVIPEGSPEAFARAAMIARTDRRPVPELPPARVSGLMLVASPGYLRSHPGETASLLSHPGNMLVVFSRERDLAGVPILARGNMPGGWALIDSRTAVLVTSSRTPYLEYQVSLL